MTRSTYEKTPKKKFKSNRQCTWVGDDGERCKQKAKGYFFCARHFAEATNMECGTFSIYTATN